ncbi:MAG TPA: FIST N-terminal domain-containing protein [Myxococcaceae bacterium]
MVFCSQSHDLPALVAGINARSGGVPLIGCTTAGEISTTGSHEASVVVTALGGDGFEIETAVASGASRNLRAAGARVARCLPLPGDRPYRALLLLTDGLAGDQQEIIRGAYGVLGAGVPLVGGCAGDDLNMARTFQLHGDQVLTDAVVAAGIASSAPLGIGVRHGWRPAGEPMLVTRSGGNRVSTLDDRPALDVYLDRLCVVGPARSSRELFSRLSLTHPLGLSHRPGEEGQVRFIGGADFAERSLHSIAEVPQGGLVWIMEGDAQSVLDATDAACGDSLAGLDGRAPLGMLAFDCIARRGVLGDRGIRREVDRLAAVAGGAPVAGFYTYGEIARTRGVRGFHNQTLVVLSVS